MKSFLTSVFAVFAFVAVADVTAPLESIEDVRVAPLVTTHWTQTGLDEEHPIYNYYTPNNYLCGCSATVGAQLMRYHAWPIVAVEPRTFANQVDGVSRNLSLIGGTYAWELMPEDPGWEILDEEREAIGHLTHDVAVSLGTHFTHDASAAAFTLLSRRFIDTFAYANAVGISFNDRVLGYTANGFANAVLPNLEAGLPVGLSVYDSSTLFAHAVVIDGYGYQDGKLYLHVNLGWAGLDDGWYEPTRIDEYDAVDALLYNVYSEGDAGLSFAAGRIVDASGVPQTNLVVNITTKAGESVAQVSTSETGSFAFALPPGNYRVRAEAEGTNLVATARVTLKENVSAAYSADGLSYSMKPMPQIGNVFLGDLVLEEQKEEPIEIGPFVNEYFCASFDALGIPQGEGKWTYKAIGLPKGLVLDAKRGVVEGVPSEAMDGTNAFAAVSVTRPDKTIELVRLPLTFVARTPRVLGALTLGDVYELDLAEIYEDVAADWTVAGLPSGLKYDKTTGLVTGKPTKAGRYTITIKTGKVAGTKYVDTYTAILTVWPEEDWLEVVNTTYEDVREGFAYFGEVTAAVGLPAGLKFDKAGCVVTGKPTKAGTNVVTFTLADKTKRAVLWTIKSSAAPELNFVDDSGEVISGDTIEVIQGMNLTSILNLTAGAKVSATGLPAGLKVAVDKLTGETSISGIPTKVGESFVTFKVTVNGVTTTVTRVFSVSANPYAATYRGLAESLSPVTGAPILAIAEVVVQPAGGVKVTYTEGKTKTSFSAKCVNAGPFVFKDGRRLELLFAEEGIGLSGNCSGMLKKVISGEVVEPKCFVYTYDFFPLLVSATYDAKKMSWSYSGTLADGTAIKSATLPFFAIEKNGMIYRFSENEDMHARFPSVPALSVGYVTDDGVHEYCVEPSAYSCGDVKFASLLDTRSVLELENGETFEMVVSYDKNGLATGVALYDLEAIEGEKAIAGITAKMGKTGLVTFTFTSKKGEKAKYRIDFRLREDGVFDGRAIRTVGKTVEIMRADIFVPIAE